MEVDDSSIIFFSTCLGLRFWGTYPQGRSKDWLKDAPNPWIAIEGICLLWAIWCVRNKIVFYGREGEGW